MSRRPARRVNGVFANIGKAIAAFERSIEPAETRFDDFAGAAAAPSRGRCASERGGDGLKLFIGKARCITCHNGPLLTDSCFHNTGVPPFAIYRRIGAASSGRAG